MQFLHKFLYCPTKAERGALVNASLPRPDVAPPARLERTTRGLGIPPSHTPHADTVLLFRVPLRNNRPFTRQTTPLAAPVFLYEFLHSRSPPGAPVSPPVTTYPKGTMMNATKKAELRRLLGDAMDDEEIEQLIAQGVQRTIAAAKAAGVALKADPLGELLPPEVAAAVREAIRTAPRDLVDAAIAALTNERGWLEEGQRQGAQLPRGKASRTLPGVFPMNPQLTQQLRAEIEIMPDAAFDGLIAALMTERAMFLEAEGRTPKPAEGETGMPAAAATKSTAGWLDDFFGLPPVAAQQAAQQAPRGVFDQLDAWARNAL